MIIEKHYNRMLRMFKASNEADIDAHKGPRKYFFMPMLHMGFETKNIFLYNKMNTDIKQGS